MGTGIGDMGVMLLNFGLTVLVVVLAARWLVRNGP
jgi:hypothetical protein